MTNLYLDPNSIYNGLIASVIYSSATKIRGLIFKRIAEGNVIREKADERLHGKIDMARDLLLQGQLALSKKTFIDLRSQNYDGSPAIRYRLAILIGSCASMSGDLEWAREEFVAATNILPDKENGWANLANIYAHQNQLDKAVECIYLAMAINEADTYVQSISCFVFYRAKKFVELNALMDRQPDIKNDARCLLILGQNKLEDKQYNEAVQLLESALEKERSNVETKFSLSQALLGSVEAISSAEPLRTTLTAEQENKIKQSIELLSSALESLKETDLIEPKERCHALKAGAYLLQGNISAAEAECHSILSGNPNSLLGLRYKASAFMLQNNDEQAIKCLEKVVSTDPEAYAALATAYLKTDQLELAKSIFLKDWDNCKTQAEIRTIAVADNLLDIALKQKDYELGQRVCNALESTFGTDPIASYSAARYWNNYGDYNKAVNLLEDALAKTNASQHDKLRSQLAYSYCRCGLLTKAIEAYKLKTNYSADDATNYVQALRRCDRFAEVIDLISTLSDEYKTIESVMEAEAYAYANLGDIKQSRNLLERLVEKYPHQPEYKLRLSQLNVILQLTW